MCYYQCFVVAIGKIKSVRPETPLVAGGMVFSMFAREMMERNPEVDLGVYLEGDETFPELLSNLDHPESAQGVYFRRNGALKFSGERCPRDLNSLRPMRVCCRAHVMHCGLPFSVSRLFIN